MGDHNLKPSEEVLEQIKRPLKLVWGQNLRNGSIHIEWHSPCGCAFHPEGYQGPHIHPCDEHRNPQPNPEE